MKEVLVSVLMPVYNTKESYLREAVESILKQTYRNFEFIVLDDGSEERVAEVIKSYRDPRIIYFNFGHLGITKQLNRGILGARGKYIARMDADDIALPERLAKQVDFLENHPEISVLGTELELFPNGRVVKRLQYPGFFDLLGGTVVGHPTVMWRKADFERYSLRYNENCSCAQDYELWSRAIRVLRFANLTEVLLRYRVHDGQVSASKQQIQAQITEQARKNMLAFLTQDVKLQQEILNLALDLRRDEKKVTRWQKLFSLSNCHFMGYKFKRLILAGHQFIFRKL